MIPDTTQVRVSRRRAVTVLAAAAGLLTSTAIGALADDKPASGPGYTADEIRIGNSGPYSGHGSTYGAVAKGIKAYLDYVNEQGGVNGRKIRFISYDDAFSAPKTVENVRRLVEQDDVLGVVGIVGTPTNSAVQGYLNKKGIPQLFASTGSSKFSRPKEYPWTTGFNPTFRTEGLLYGDYVRQHYPNAKIAILYQHDDYGREVLQGALDGLGEAAANVVEKISYEATQPTLDSEVLKARASGAEVFINISMARAASQSIRKVHELGWKPVHIINAVGNSVGGVLTPAGLEAAEGLISSNHLRDPGDPGQASHPEVVRYLAFLDTYLPGTDKNDTSYLTGYAIAQTLVQVLKQAGNDLSRENVLRQATSLRGFHPEMVVDGLTVDTSPEDYRALKQTRLMQFRDGRWKAIGGLRSGL